MDSRFLDSRFHGNDGGSVRVRQLAETEGKEESWNDKGKTGMTEKREKSEENKGVQHL